MNEISYVGVLIVISVIFLVLKLTNKSESSVKLLWVAIIGVLAVLGLTVLSGDWK